MQIIRGMKRWFDDKLHFHFDPLKRYSFDRNSEDDLKMVEEMQKAVREMGKECFLKCFKNEIVKQSCVELCVDSKLNLAQKTISNGNISNNSH